MRTDAGKMKQNGIRLMKKEAERKPRAKTQVRKLYKGEGISVITKAQSRHILEIVRSVGRLPPAPLPLILSGRA